MIIEDDPTLGPSLKEHLQMESFDVHLAPNIAKAKELTENNQFELIILDWMLPDGQGIDFLRDFRATNSRTPVIMLTARTELIDKVLGLETGANDYLTKPFEPRELIARIRVQLRGLENIKEDTSNGQISYGPIWIDSIERKVKFNDVEIEMTKMEFDLIRLLTENPGRAFSREELLNKVWGFENYPTTRTVDTHVLQLRQKLSDEIIETLRGVGYRLKKL